MEFEDGELFIDKPLNDLDRLVLEVTEHLTALDIEYAVISGYVAVLLGRSRATEDIDVIVERFDRSTAVDLADSLREAKFWGPAMPLDDCYETLADDLPIRVARDGEHVPNVELKFASDEYDRAALRETVAVTIGDESLTIGSLELQIAYKLKMGADRDYEDALYLHEVLGTNLNQRALEEYVKRLDVTDEYDRLRRT